MSIEKFEESVQNAISANSDMHPLLADAIRVAMATMEVDGEPLLINQWFDVLPPPYTRGNCYCYVAIDSNVEKKKC